MRRLLFTPRLNIFDCGLVGLGVGASQSGEVGYTLAVIAIVIVGLWFSYRVERRL